MSNQPKSLLVIAMTAMSFIPIVALAQELQSADTGAAPAQDGPRHHHHRDGSPEFKQFESTLTPAQKEQMDNIRKEAKGDAAPLIEKMKSLREQLSANPAPKNADDLKTQLQTLHEQLRSQFKSTHERMLSVLTDDQKAQLAKIREQRKERFEQRQQEKKGADADTK